MHSWLQQNYYLTYLLLDKTRTRRTFFLIVYQKTAKRRNIFIM